LLEVLVALAVFALAAVVLGSAYVNVLNGYDIAKRSNARNEDLQFALSQLLNTPDRDDAEKGAAFDSANGRHVTWHAKIDPTETVDVFSVAFTCEINDSSAQPSDDTVTQNFMLLRPTWSDATDRSKLLADVKARIAKIQGVTPQQ
jgi:general secretion pathway protein I